MSSKHSSPSTMSSWRTQIPPEDRCQPLLIEYWCLQSDTERMGAPEGDDSDLMSFSEQIKPELRTQHLPPLSFSISKSGASGGWFLVFVVVVLLLLTTSLSPYFIVQSPSQYKRRTQNFQSKNHSASSFFLYQVRISYVLLCHHYLSSLLILLLVFHPHEGIPT